MDVEKLKARKADIRYDASLECLSKIIKTGIPMAQIWTCEKIAKKIHFDSASSACTSFSLKAMAPVTRIEMPIIIPSGIMNG